MKLGQKLAIGLIRAKLNLVGAVHPSLAGKMAFRLFCTPFRKTRKKRPDVFDKAEQHSFQFENYEVKGFIWNGTAEKKVLIAHGFESTSYNFDRYVMPLVKAGFGVIAFDAPAHGISSGKMVNVLQYAAFLEELAKRYGPIYGILAHSFAGQASALWLEKETSAIQRIVWIAPATEVTSAVNSFISFLQLSPTISKHFLSEIERVGGKEISWYSVSRAVQHISVPILWIHDEEDAVTPIEDVVPVMKTGQPNIRFMITKGWGHRQIYRENKVKKEVIAFLKGED
ncbi:MAG: alpha/beta hydrolase [Chitinophagaceae bacterium]